MSIIYDLTALDPALRSAIEASPRWQAFFSAKPDQMVFLDDNAKTIKGIARGFRTAIMYLTPARKSGVQVCPMAALAMCEAPCLRTAGRLKMTVNQMSSLRRTLFLFQYKDAAVAMIKRDIAAAARACATSGHTLLVRLNGTSDIRFENYDIIQSFPDVQFYDYTKIPNRKNLPANYDLTFSYSGVAAYLPFVRRAIAAGMRVAVVFRNRAIVKRMLANGETFEGLPVVDGDDSDIRHLDPLGSIVALYAKGDAKTDDSGFVVG